MGGPPCVVLFDRRHVAVFYRLLTSHRHIRTFPELRRCRCVLLDAALLGLSRCAFFFPSPLEAYKYVFLFVVKQSSRSDSPTQQHILLYIITGGSSTVKERIGRALRLYRESNNAGEGYGGVLVQV